MRILLLGANGYLGQHLSQCLSKTESVLGLVRRSFYSDYCNIVNLNNEKWEDIILDFEPELIVNTITCYGRYGESAEKILDANVTLPIKIISRISEEIKNFTFINCGTSLPREVNLYALTKCQLDELLIYYSHMRGFNYINLNLEGFYGVACQNSFINHIFKQCIRGNDINLTLGEQYRDYIYIEDLLSAITTIIQNISKVKVYKKIDIGTGHPIQIKELVSKICKLTSYNKEPRYGVLKYRENELMYSCPDISILSGLGWKSLYDIDSGLSDLYSKEFK
ncbi:NAD-dependent epimerase/dehydratase family protein [Vibrio mangrovi]|uniref:CDP-abequose synthase n=1 Tax=Vibrio mangrovi TaxID=474394 RepID=A0A1Y6IV22_9VIBR|nr:NAD(P)-dependent oxidoreductase [Vibrio mangrovi]MDW6002170.1 NAD(P)-dependent oxidoreductase [Vibrio mangrovi]SMS01515.1 CDP-abequose synthase [Vibrio mangrovi]